MENQNNFVLNDLAVDALRVSAKWTMFLSILGFIGIAFMVLGGLGAMVSFSSMPSEPSFGRFSPFGAFGAYIGIFYLVFAVIYFFPIFYLYKYSKGIKEALSYHNNDLLTEALCYLKAHHKFLGIMAIVVLSLYVVMFIGIFVFAASMYGGGM